MDDRRGDRARDVGGMPCAGLERGGAEPALGGNDMPEKNPFVLFARYSAVIFVLPSCLLLGYFAGAYLDKRFATSPYLTLVGFLLGTAAGFIQVFRIVGKKP